MAALVRQDRYHFFPAWCRRAVLDGLHERPLFIVGDGYGERSFMVRDFDVRGWADARHAEFLVDGALWHVGYPATRRIERFWHGDLPHLFSVARRAGVQAIASTVGIAGRDGVPRLEVEHWLEQAKRTPNSLSIIIAQGADARRYRRLARAHGIDALTVSEALRTPSFAG